MSELVGPLAHGRMREGWHSLGYNKRWVGASGENKLKGH